MAETKQVLIGENLFDMSEGKPSLIVTHCTSCGDYFFPKSFTCHNPNCAEKQVEQTHLSRYGKVENYSVMNYPPPPPFVTKEPYEPIVCAAVEFPEGITIIGMMEGTTADEVRSAWTSKSPSARCIPTRRTKRSSPGSSRRSRSSCC